MTVSDHFIPKAFCAGSSYLFKTLSEHIVFSGLHPFFSQNVRMTLARRNLDSIARRTIWFQISWSTPRASSRMSGLRDLMKSDWAVMMRCLMETPHKNKREITGENHPPSSPQEGEDRNLTTWSWIKCVTPGERTLKEIPGSQAFRYICSLCFCGFFGVFCSVGFF